MNERQKEVMQAQVDREKEILNRLKLVYAQAQDDCANKIIDLSRRRDMENIQSIIYQKKYQEALKGQIDEILDKFHNNEYKTVSEYLHDCYENGYIGTMYDLAGQDIPLIMPIDQQQVIKAVEMDAKLTTKKRYTDGEGNKVSLYEKLGANVDELKDDIRFQVSRGIVNGSSWNQIGAELAKGMKHTPFEKAMNRTVTIARTEGHRIQCQAAMDAQYKAKSAGADVLKQWDSTLDGRTRETHRRLDGQIREVDEYFEVDGKKAMYPGGFGDPSEDCNCRCAMLQRARWALDEEELEELKERAEFFGLDKTKDFEKFKKKYLQIVGNKNNIIADDSTKNSGIVLRKLKDVTEEYRQRVREEGDYHIEDNYNHNEHDEEIKIAEWIYNTYGGNITVLKEINLDHEETPDYLWNGKLWELKTPDKMTLNAIDKRLQKGIHQISNNPGGVIINLKKDELALSDIAKKIENRMTRHSDDSSVYDVMVIVDGELKIVIRK